MTAPQGPWGRPADAERGDEQGEPLGEFLKCDAGVADEAEQLVSEHGVLVVAQALDQLHAAITAPAGTSSWSLGIGPLCRSA
jgi:hypothetical protein